MLRRKKLDKQAAILRERAQNVLLFVGENAAIGRRIVYKFAIM
jgi:hypothetical protein